MNSAVYTYLLSTYGKKIGFWTAAITELAKTLITRVFLGFVMANATSQLAKGDIEGAKHTVLLFLIVALGGALISPVGDIIGMQAENNAYKKLRMAFYLKLTGKDMSFYRDHQTGYLTSIYRQHLDAMILLARFIRVDATNMGVSLIAPMIVLLFVNIQVGLVAFGVVLAQLFYIFWASKKANYYRHLSHEAYRKTTGEVTDEITNIVAFKSSGLEDRGQSRVAALGEEETRAFWLRRKITTLLDFPRGVTVAMGISLAFWAAIDHAGNGTASVGLMVLTLTYMFQISRSVEALPGLIIQHDDLVTKIHPTLPYLNSDCETISDPPDAERFQVTKGEVNFSNISFAYPSSSGTMIPVFNNFNLTVTSGERVGIVGLSGAGKSTLANLLLRFDDVQSGQITIDGTAITQIKQSDLRRAIAYVPQEPLLFHRSIKENIAYFQDDAAEKEIIKAAKAAHAHEFIADLPEGYNTIVGERGVKLSGGQKQRVVIARAILKNAPIMLFDEATSALDSESEQIIHKALPQIIGKHTALVIAHRLSTIADLDRIIVIHKGKIVEEGTHQALLKKGGQYYKLWQKQSKS